MIDVHSAILWWEEWQLRILVLGSLGIQFFLLVAAPMRKYTIWSSFRRCIWLAYISSDALAIYALATLFNRHVRAGRGGRYDDDAAAVKATSLEVLWAPLLLVHLGGRDEITAFDIQDNELWTRHTHTVTIVSQVTVALYAFYKSWPGGADRRLLLSAIMLFINGVINFCQKLWALRNASMNRLVAVSSIIRGQRRERVVWERCFTEMEGSYKLCCWKKYEPAAAAAAPEAATAAAAVERARRTLLSSMDQVQVILSDISLLATVGNKEKKHFLEQLSPGVDMTDWLRRAFEIIYTRANVVHAPVYAACDLLLVPALYIIAIVLFAMGRKQGYNATDVKLTYVFMVFTAVLDSLGLFISRLVYWLMSMTTTPALCMTLPEYNLIDSVANRMGPVKGRLLKCVTCLGYEDYSTSRRCWSATVAEFVVSKLLRPGRVEGLDLASYRSLTKYNWILGDELQHLVVQGGGGGGGGTDDDQMKMVRTSLRDSPFDESVLLWHIATDLCTSTDTVATDRDICTQVISNYMGYLLKFRPEMLMTGSRPQLFTLTMDDLEKLLKEKNMSTPLSRRQAVWEIIKASVEEDDHSPALIRDAYKLADELLRQDQKTRWELMHRVWMGMLCYSASMCRGYLHAKSLGEGGEFLSYVWIVISLKGAKTLADKLQMSEEANTSGRSPEEESEEADVTSMFHSARF
ncbi:hypothetical protein GQ55_8G050900 [Panicum hallii var. hallii]|uniref:DUF4220 domain-containing protein n=1 Tax=Panicum hallii var. hallii TaxID=1504633 RepID=A0A2T7CKY4_9POAL|nr:hypothetical protein GQ55_8G050900 [Panicum hallii var. hallii]